MLKSFKNIMSDSENAYSYYYENIIFGEKCYIQFLDN